MQLKTPIEIQNAYNTLSNEICIDSNQWCLFSAWISTLLLAGFLSSSSLFLSLSLPSLSLNRLMILSFTWLDPPYPITIFITCVWSLSACDLCIHTHWAAGHVSAMNKLTTVTVIHGHCDCFCLFIHTLNCRLDWVFPANHQHSHLFAYIINYIRIIIVVLNLHNDTCRHLGHSYINCHEWLKKKIGQWGDTIFEVNWENFYVHI